MIPLRFTACLPHRTTTIYGAPPPPPPQRYTSAGMYPAWVILGTQSTDLPPTLVFEEIDPDWVAQQVQPVADGSTSRFTAAPILKRRHDDTLPFAPRLLGRRPRVSRP